MNIDVELIEKVVKKVLNDVETGSSESEYGYGIFDTMDEAIEASAKAQKEYMNHSMADRQRYVEGIREVVCTKENLEYMSKLAVEESGMGAYEYKVIKNRLAAVKSPGVMEILPFPVTSCQLPSFPAFASIFVIENPSGI